jgi:hypothetical protein
MQELLQWMEYIEDRRQQRKARHPLTDILVIVLFPTLANADNWVEMALFAEDYQDCLRNRMLCIGNNTYADGIKQTGAAGFFSAPVCSFTGRLWAFR